VIQGGDSLDAQRQALGQQTNAATMQDQEARYSSVSELSLDVDKAIADHPRLVPCFEAGRCQATLTSDELHQAEALAVYIVDFYQYLYAQLENLGYVPSSGLFSLRKDNASSDESWITWSETIVGGFRDSQLVCDALKNAVPAYEDRFVHAVAVTGVCPGLKQ
jgi:hypothetical protein